MTERKRTTLTQVEIQGWGTGIFFQPNPAQHHISPIPNSPLWGGCQKCSAPPPPTSNPISAPTSTLKQQQPFRPKQVGLLHTVSIYISTYSRKFEWKSKIMTQIINILKFFYRKRSENSQGTMFKTFLIYEVDSLQRYICVCDYAYICLCSFLLKEFSRNTNYLSILPQSICINVQSMFQSTNTLNE